MPGYDRCVVKLLDAYLLLLQPKPPYFYMQVSDFFPSDPAKTCARKQRVGINTLKNVVPDLSRKYGIGVHYTNHSLHPTAIIRMFRSGITEKVIAETSGHRSTSALRCYEHTSAEQKLAVTLCINMASYTMANNKRFLNSPQSFSGTFSSCTFPTTDLSLSAFV